MQFRPKQCNFKLKFNAKELKIFSPYFHLGENYFTPNQTCPQQQYINYQQSELYQKRSSQVK